MKPKVVISNHAIYVRDEPVILKVTNLHFPQNKNINFKIVASSFEQDILICLEIIAFFVKTGFYYFFSYIFTYISIEPLNILKIE